MDNLSTHRGYPFCEVVAELSGITCPSQAELNSLEERVKWLTSPDKKIVIQVLHRITVRGLTLLSFGLVL